MRIPATSAPIKKGKVLILAPVLLLALLFLNSCAGGPGSGAGEENRSTVRISISVESSSVLDNPGSKQAARDILALLTDRGLADERGSFFEGELVLEGGATAFDALLATELNVAYDSSSFGPFVRAINGLGAGDGGATSGWIYLVNGEVPAISSGLFKLSDDDRLHWRYSVDEGDARGDLP